MSSSHLIVSRFIVERRIDCKLTIDLSDLQVSAFFKQIANSLLKDGMEIFLFSAKVFVWVLQIQDIFRRWWLVPIMKNIVKNKASSYFSEMQNSLFCEKIIIIFNNLTSLMFLYGIFAIKKESKRFYFQ